MSSTAIKALAIAARAGKAATQGTKAQRILTYDELLKGSKSVPQTLDDIPEQLASELEAARITGVTDVQSGTRAIVSQTINEAEFKERLLGQLKDPEYSAKNTLQIEDLQNSINPDYATPGEQRYLDLVNKIKSSAKRHDATVNKVLTTLRKDTRWVSATNDWWANSPYKGTLQFHIDRFTDPSRPDSFIQFTEPREFGIHSGSNNAAEHRIDPRGIESVMEDARMQEKALIQVAKELNMELKQVELILADSLNRHFLQRFTKNGDINIWDDSREMFEEFAHSMGAASDTAGRFVQRLVDIPTPSTTPFLFRGMNGLFLEDAGGFKAEEISNQLLAIFNNSADQFAIDAAMGAIGETQKQLALIEFIESKGYDHALYYNAIEDQGALSYINWNPDLMASPWDKQFHQSPNGQARAATQYVIGVLGLGGANAVIREEE